MPFRCLLSLIACLIAFTGFAAGKGPRLEIGEFAARRVTKPPTVDGRIAPGEWDEALVTSGVMAPFEQVMQETQTTFGFCFDQERFYFLARCVRGDREWWLRKSVRENDGYSFGDPSIEIWVTPPSLVPETYQNIVNTYPAVLDQHMIPTRGYTAFGWKGDWELGVQESDTEYVIEASIPFKDFGFEGVKGGDVWRFLLCRTSPGSQPRSQASWSLTQGFAEIAQHPQVHLRDDGALLQFRGASSLLSGKPKFAVAAVAPRQQAEELTLELRWHKNADHQDTDKVERQTIALQAGERRELVLEPSIPEDQTFVPERSQEGHRRGYLTVSATAKDGTLVFRHAYPYVLSGWAPKKPTRPEKQPEPEPMTVRAMYGPESSIAIVRADIIDLPTREQVVGGKVEVVGNPGFKLDVPLPPFRNWYSNVHFEIPEKAVPTRDFGKEAYIRKQIENAEKANEQRRKKGQKEKPLPQIPEVEPKEVELKITVVDAEGKELASQTAPLKLRRYKFRWADNDIGVSDRVPPPWSPVAMDGATAKLWNRQYQLNGLGLLDSIDNHGVKQIESMRLVAIKDGKEIEIQAGEPILDREVDARVDFHGEGRGAGLHLTATNRLDHDGFLRSRLTIAPAAEPVQIDELYLEVVMPESEATHFCTTAGGWAAIHDVTPEYWTSQTTANGMLIGDFVPYIWLTNSDRAFVWVADNDQGWFTDDDKSKPTQDVTRKDGRVTLRVRYIEIPTELTQPTTLEYAWQTFPSRPLPDGWRTIICNQNTTELPGAKYTYFWFDGNWAVLWPYYCSPFAWSWDKSRELFLGVAASRHDGHRPMVGSIAHSVGRYRDYEGNTFQEYSVDWGSTPGDGGNANVASSDGPNDFRLYHYREWVRQAGFKGLYVDENYISLDRNFISGGAYIRPDGRLQPGYSYLGLRDYFMRMKTMYWQEGVKRPNLWQHISSGAAYFAWPGDIFFEGENVGPTNLEFDYLRVLPAGRMRAIGSSKCVGGAMTMMCQGKRHATEWKHKHVHQFIGWVLAHDILPEQVGEYYPIAQEARFYEADVEFVGYWKDDNPLRATTPDCLVSIHRQGDHRAIAWVVNTSRQDRPVDVSVDWRQLGFDRARTIGLDAETGEQIPLSAKGFTVDVLQRDWVAVHLVERRTLAGAESFVATFEGNHRHADEALGSPMILTDGQLALVAGRDGGEAARVQGAINLWPHLHVQDQAGRLTFDAKVAAGARGTIFTTTGPRQRISEPTREFPLPIALQQDPRDGLVLTQVPPRGKREVEVPEPAKAPALEPGWHSFDLRWADGRIHLQVDGKDLGSTKCDGMNVCAGRGRALLESGYFTFGGQRSAIEAVDNIRCYRAD